jgi:hypothetical protein
MAHVFRPNGLTLGRPPYSSLPSPGDLVPMVPYLITCYRGGVAMSDGDMTDSSTRVPVVRRVLVSMVMPCLV